MFFNVKTVDTTAKDLWDNLNGVYEDKSLINMIYLMRQLYNLKMKDKVSNHDHFNKFNAFVTDLLGIRVKIDEEEQTTILLCLMLDP